MTESASPIDTLLDLETRHEELLDQLAELDQQVEQVLRQWQGGRMDEAPSDGVEADSTRPECGSAAEQGEHNPP
jgi:hypothetical protein